MLNLLVASTEDCAVRMLAAFGASSCSHGTKAKWCRQDSEHVSRTHRNAQKFIAIGGEMLRCGADVDGGMIPGTAVRRNCCFDWDTSILIQEVTTL